MSVVDEAASAQSSTGYGVDVWMELQLEPMTKVWQGRGGVSNFFFSEEDARQATGAYEGSVPMRFAESLWRMAQVSPSMKHGYRDAIDEFVVDMPVTAAVGICQANSSLGSGSVFQYYIPDWQSYLFKTTRTYRFRNKSFSEF